ncbi:CBS domain-containing protein [Desulfobacter curvatus]|uniref:CBS domain-containing protein n=1 Tax=Desulfobacter curvatus TaxID=2290 RepID=UPI00036E431D|nr:CBS domain-containing protein [Desulfobacter curvatus]
MKLEDLIKNDTGHFYTVEGDQTVSQALQQMSAYGASAVVVMALETPVGIFTERDLVRCQILFPDKRADQVTIDKVMTSKLIVAQPQDSVDAAMAMMIKARIRHLPVVGDKKIIALVSLEDLVKAHVGALTQELHYLKDYISDLQDAAHD